MFLNLYKIFFLPLLPFLHLWDVPQHDAGQTITVIVHGTKPPERVAHVFNVVHKFFYTPQGLHTATLVDNSYRFGKIVRMLNESDPREFPLENVYLFGWSGALSPQERREAAERLYDGLREVLRGYPATTKVRVITHSHGGNVVLNLPLVQKDKPFRIIVDELVLLACPVQQQTAENLKNPMFREIIACYSKNDILQIIDLQGMHKENESQRKHGSLFSKRRFKKQDNLVQARIKSRGWDLAHIEFLLPHFIKKLPKTVNAIKSKRDKFQSRFPDKNIIEIQKL